MRTSALIVSWHTLCRRWDAFSMLWLHRRGARARENCARGGTVVGPAHAHIAMNVGQLLLAVASMVLITLVAVGLARRLQLGSIVPLLLVGILLGPHSPWPLFTGHVE